jgi:E3 ubiquitin-protein ligase RNF213
MSTVIDQEQKKFVKYLKIPADGIAINTALKENTFTSFVCIMNKIPVLIIGSPGSSKSLSVRILASNLNGKSSEVDICKHYPEINMTYFQGSESSTSEGIEEVFSKVNMTMSTNYNNLSCIYFDEIGLAEKSLHNPLKVLHSKLEVHAEEKVAFIGISNDELDAAKMSRFLTLSRPEPSLEELKETAKKIFEKENTSGQLTGQLKNKI